MRHFQWIWLLLGMLISLASKANAQTYTVTYVVTPSNVIIYALADAANKSRHCESIDGDSITPELVRRTGASLFAWSFIRSDKTLGYATWVSEKSGIHTTYVANYILANCALTETRTHQKTFDGPNRAEQARVEYNRQVLRMLAK